MAQEVTKGQIGSIVALLVAGKVPHEAAQAFIDKYSGAPSRKCRPPSDPHFAFWEQQYPGKGVAITDFLRPFYSWRPGINYTSLDIGDRARQAIFWRKITGTRLYDLSSLDELRDELSESLVPSLTDSIHIPREDSLRQKLHTELWGSSQDTNHDTLGDLLRETLRDLLYEMLCLLIANRRGMVAQFRSLLDLWIAGNYPIGFDEAGNLLILVAKA